jgi:hypothetical protein
MLSSQVRPKVCNDLALLGSTVFVALGVRALYAHYCTGAIESKGAEYARLFFLLPVFAITARLFNRSTGLVAAALIPFPASGQPIHGSVF